MYRSIRKYQTIGIGGILFSINIIIVALHIIYSQVTNNIIIMTCFILAGIGIILLGAGIFGSIFRYQEYPTQLLVVYIWVSGFILIIYYSIFYPLGILTSFGLACLFAFPASFIFLGVYYLINRDFLLYENLSLIIAIPIIALNAQFLVFLIIALNTSNIEIIIYNSLYLQGLTGFIIAAVYFIEYIKLRKRIRMERT